MPIFLYKMPLGMSVFLPLMDPVIYKYNLCLDNHAGIWLYKSCENAFTRLNTRGLYMREIQAHGADVFAPPTDEQIAQHHRDCRENPWHYTSHRSLGGQCLIVYATKPDGSLVAVLSCYPASENALQHIIELHNRSLEQAWNNVGAE